MMTDFTQRTSAGALDPASFELEQWHRFVHLLLLLVQSGRLDPSDGIALVEALGQPPDVARGRSALFEIVRRHEPGALGDEWCARPDAVARRGA
jgi:hypothetical protein